MAAWSALPHDMIQIIVGKLYVADRIRFRAVCKDWYLASIKREGQPSYINKQLPWIMNYRFTRSERICVLFEPFCRHPYITQHNINIMEDVNDAERGRITPTGDISLCSAIASKSGWVLLLTGRNTRSWTEPVMSYQVYNPLTGKVIDLPDLTFQTIPIHLGAFSSDPTSPDCVFFVPQLFDGDQVCFSTYSVGDKSWKTHTFTWPDARKYNVESVVYMEGSFYCFGVWALLSSFNVASGEWKPLTTAVTITSAWWPNIRFLVECGGVLMIAYTTLSRKTSLAEPQIFRFDFRDRVWVKMESLDGGAIFFGPTFAFGVPAAGGRDDTTKFIAKNRVYHFHDDISPAFMTYGPGPGPESCSRLEKEERLTDYADAWDIRPLHHSLPEERIWIQPPLLQS